MNIFDQAAAATRARRRREEAQAKEQTELARKAERLRIEETAREEAIYKQQQAREGVAASELDRFLESSEGRSAMRFLGELDKLLLIAYDGSDGGGYGWGIHLSARGLISQTEPEGTWQIYGTPADHEKRRQEMIASRKPVSSQEALRLFCACARTDNRKAENMVPWLRQELTNLANKHLDQ